MSEEDIDKRAKALDKYFVVFFTTVIGIATFGASVTFALILTPTVELPSNSKFGSETVQEFLAIGWLCFVVALAIAGFSAALFNFYREDLRKARFEPIDKHCSPKMCFLRWSGTVASATLFGFITTAFMFISFVIWAYVPRVGKAAVAFTSLFGFLGLTTVVIQLDFRYKRDKPAKVVNTGLKKTDP
jgi:hypothetical protein